MAVLYVGAGTDLRRVLRIAGAGQSLVLVDSQPCSEFGKTLSGLLRPDGSDGFSRPRFPRHVANQLKKHRVERDGARSTEDVWRCTRTGVHLLTYYMNTSVPEDLARVADVELRLVDTLFVMGHHPHGDVLGALPRRPLHFIGGDGTSYADDDEGDSLVHRLHHSAAARCAFDRFTYVHFDAGPAKEACAFADWFGFAEYARTQLRRLQSE